MSDPGDEYQQFFDAIRAADRDIIAALATGDWELAELARCKYRRAIEELVTYILH